MVSTLDEHQRRLYVGIEAQRLGHGGDRILAQITGLSVATIAAGRREVESAQPTEHIRAPGGGRPRVEKKDPTILGALERLLHNQTAGDPQSARKWKRKSLQQLSRQLAPEHKACPHTVGRLLREQQYSLHINYKELDSRASPHRNEQFEYIQAQIQAFLKQGWPIISVDTKKRELIGAFRNPGRVWCRKPTWVNVYDFRSLAKGIAIPYGIYDLTRNAGYVFIGTTADTSEFAVDAIQWWWTTYGRLHYPQAPALLILADGGGSNAYRTRLWKYTLQHQLVNSSGLAVTATHFPTGASKWNPADHRLFSAISCNWAGEPLTSYDKLLHLIDSTTTEQGLVVRATLTQKTYATEIKISDEQMAALNIETHTTLPQWNYTIKPLTKNR